MQTLNEFLEKHYINNIETLEKSIQVLEKKNSSETEYFFNNIIFFTNERDPKKNKTLNNLLDAIKGKDVNLVIFVTDEVSYKAEDDYITIKDSKTSYTIKEQSNADTIVIVRLGAQDDMECMEAIKELQNWGLFVINPINRGLVASNKYQSAVLMERYGIPQPRYALLSIDDVSDGMDSLSKKLEVIYPDLKSMSKEKQQECEYVIKLLGGHGGCGVFLCDGSSILGILQAMFAVDKELELLLQKKEEMLIIVIIYFKNIRFYSMSNTYCLGNNILGNKLTDCFFIHISFGQQIIKQGMIFGNQVHIIILINNITS